MPRLPPPSVILARVAAKKEQDRKTQEAMVHIETVLLTQTQDGYPPYRIVLSDKPLVGIDKALILSLIEQVLGDHNKHYDCGKYYISDATKDAIHVDVQGIEGL